MKEERERNRNWFGQMSEGMREAFYRDVVTNHVLSSGYAEGLSYSQALERLAIKSAELREEHMKKAIEKARLGFVAF